MSVLVAKAFHYIHGISARHMPDESALILNTRINRLDIEMDAKTGSAADGTMVQTKDPYTTAMTQLFPGIDVRDPLTQLGNIEHDIFDALVLGPKGKPESWLKKQGKGYTSSFMPEHVTNTYHDSGYNPKEIIADYTAWITPGSFIDPAGRDKPNMPRTAKYPADGESIRIPLDGFGFSGIVFTAIMLPNNECQVIITIPGVADVNITRDVNFESMGEGIDYFCGNPQKNAAINGQPNNANGIAEIKKYVISKELSDFSQIFFAIINMFRLHNEQPLYKHCMFTTDNVVAARSKFMGLQSCLQDHKKTDDKSSHRVIMYYAEMNAGNADMELRRTYLNSCLKNNLTVKAHIAKAIIEGLYFVSEDRKFVGEGEIKKYLLEILEAIDIATGLAQALPLEGPAALEPDVYKKEIKKYIANTPINENGRIVQSLQRLFVNCPELRDVDAIHRGGSPFGVVISYFIKQRENRERIVSSGARGTRGDRGKTRKFLNLRKMKGGARATDEELRSLFASETGQWDGSVVPISEGSLLHHMRLILQVNESDFEDFIFRAFNHLIYICETPLDQRLIYIYQNIDRIENSTLDSFNTEYIGYSTNPDVLALASLARTRLVAARAYDPMGMLADTQLPSEEIEADIEAPVEAPVEEIEAPIEAVLDEPQDEQIEVPPANDGYETNVYPIQQVIKQSPKFKQINSEVQRKLREQKSLNLRKKFRNATIRNKRFGIQKQLPPESMIWARKTRKSKGRK